MQVFNAEISDNNCIIITARLPAMREGALLDFFQTEAQQGKTVGSARLHAGRGGAGLNGLIATIRYLLRCRNRR